MVSVRDVPHDSKLTAPVKSDIVELVATISQPVDKANCCATTEAVQQQKLCNNARISQPVDKTNCCETTKAVQQQQLLWNNKDLSEGSRQIIIILRKCPPPQTPYRKTCIVAGHPLIQGAYFLQRGWRILLPPPSNVLGSALPLVAQGNHVSCTLVLCWRLRWRPRLLSGRWCDYRACARRGAPQSA